MFAAILAIMLLPITDLGRSKGLQFRPLSKIVFWIFVANFLILMKLGACHVETPFIELGQISTVLYFGYFVLIVPVISLIENSLIDLTFKSKKILNPNLYRGNGLYQPYFKRSISSRSFHSTNSLKLDLPSIVHGLTPLFDIYHMLNLESCISSTISVIQSSSIPTDEAQKLIDFLDSTQKYGDQIRQVAEAWGIDLSNLKEVVYNPDSSPEEKSSALKELNALRDEYNKSINKLDWYCSKAYSNTYIGKPDIKTVPTQLGNPDGATKAAQELVKRFNPFNK